MSVKSVTQCNSEQTLCNSVQVSHSVQVIHSGKLCANSSFLSDVSGGHIDVRDRRGQLLDDARVEEATQSVWRCAAALW